MSAEPMEIQEEPALTSWAKRADVGQLLAAMLAVYTFSRYFSRAMQVRTPRLVTATRVGRPAEPTEPPLATNAM